MKITAGKTNGGHIKHARMTAELKNATPSATCRDMGNAGCEIWGGHVPGVEGCDALGHLRRQLVVRRHRLVEALEVLLADVRRPLGDARLRERLDSNDSLEAAAAAATDAAAAAPERVYAIQCRATDAVEDGSRPLMASVDAGFVMVRRGL